MTDQPIDRRTAEQTTKNLELAKQFLAEVLEDESLLRAVPEGARIVLLPGDQDPELTEMNTELAHRETMSGRPVHLQRIGGAEDPGYTIGSGNVYADLGVPDPELALDKARLARHINALIADSGLSTVQAAALLGLDEARVHDLARGRLRAFSVEQLKGIVSLIDLAAPGN